MPLVKYSIRKLIKGDPTTVAALRDDMYEKLKGWKSNGTFIFTLETKADGDSALVISSGDVHKKPYAPLAKPAIPNEFLFGKYTAVEKPPTFEFTVDDAVPSDVADRLINHQQFSLKLWPLLPRQTTLVKVTWKGKSSRQTKQFAPPTLVGASKTERNFVFNLTQALALAGTKDSLLPGPALEGIAPYDPKKTHFISKGGLTFETNCTISTSVSGKILKDAVDDPLLAQKLHEAVLPVFKELGSAFKAEIIKVDNAALAETLKIKDGDPKKLAKVQETALGKLKPKLVEFQKELQVQAEQAFVDVWHNLVQIRVERRAYEWECGINIAKGTLMTAIGIATAVVGGVTGVGAVLGVVGTLKDAAALVGEVYKAFQDVTSLSKDINDALKSLSAQYVSKADWQELGKAALKEVPVVGQFLQSTAPGTWTLATLDKNIKTYDSKLKGLIVNAHDLAQTIPRLMDKSAALDPDVGKKLEKKLHLLLEKVSKLNTDYEEGKASHKSYVDWSTTLAAAMKKPENVSKLAAALKRYAVPLLSLPWGVDPGDTTMTIIACFSTVADIGKEAIDAQLEGKEGAQLASDWIQYIKDVSVAVGGLGKTIADG